MLCEEAVGVCLHDGYRVTLRWLVNRMCLPVALLVVNVSEEDASGALARHLRKIDIEGESAAKVDLVVEGPLRVAVPLFVGDKGAVVVSNRKAFVLGLKVASVETLDMELIPLAVTSVAPILNVAGELLPLCLLIFTITIAITVAIVIFPLFVLAFNFDMEAIERPFGVFTARWPWRIVSFEVRATVSVIPVRDNDCHVALEIMVQRREVVLALGLHNDLLVLLFDRSSDLPEIIVVILRDKVCLDLEPVFGVDHGAIGPKGIFSVFLCALLSQVVIAPGFFVADTVFARMCR